VSIVHWNIEELQPEDGFKRKAETCSCHLLNIIYIFFIQQKVLLRAPYTLQGPIHSTLNCAVCLCKKTARKTELNVLWHSTGFPSGLSGFFLVSSVCFFGRVTMVDKNKAVVCCLLATSAIMLSEKKKRKRKMWSKKWYLERNISCDAHLLNELLETDVPWDDAIVVSAGKISKLWDSLSELRSSPCERLERIVPRPALLPVKTAQFSQFFRQVWRHTVKSLSLTESV
jgi:hypothetical protein